MVDRRSRRSSGQILIRDEELSLYMAAITLPEDVYDALRLPEDEREDVIREELAISLYVRGALSFGKARELADCTHQEFQTLLAERDVSRHYTEEEFDEDVEYARR